VTGNVWYPSWAPDTIKAAYSAKEAALAEAEKKYQTVTNNVSVGALLYGMGVYAKGETLPTTKGQLKIAINKIADMISSLNATQSTLSTDVNSLNNELQKMISLASDRVKNYEDAMKELNASSR
jgi:hypothetical protein